MQENKGTLSQAKQVARSSQKRRLLRYALAALTAVTFSLLVSSLALQRSKYEATEIYQDLVDAGEVLPIESFQAEFLACEAGDFAKPCTSLTRGVTLRFPDVKSIADTVAALPSPATHVVLRHPLSDTERAWVRKHNSLSVVAVRNVHVETFLGEENARVAIGNGSTVVLAAGRNSLANADGDLALTLAIGGLPWFGPGEFPFLLVSEDATATVQGLASAQASASALGRQLQLSIPFVIAVLALFLDHAPVFQPLALLAGLRGLRAFFGLASETPWGEALHDAHPLALKILLGGLNGLTAASFFLLAVSMAKTPSHIKKRLWVFLPVLPVAFAVHAVTRPDAWLTGDSLADTLGAGGAGAVLLLAALRVHGTRKMASAKVSLTESLTESRRARIEHAADLGSLLLAAAIFLLLMAANGEEMLARGKAKSIIDWRYALFYPGLLLIAFARVGSSSKVIEVISGDLIRKRLLESELFTAKKQMQIMQGPPRGTEAGITWRVWQRQCVSVGGDFFDVRKLTFADRDLLVAVVLDVTGHGIQAAMIARSLSDAWATWCADATRARSKDNTAGSLLRPAPSTREERESFLARAPARLLTHLSAARAPGSCTAVFALVDAGSREVTICNAGHPSPLFVGPVSHLSLTPKGSHPMVSASTVLAEWTPNTYPMADQTLFLYSDGLFSDELGARASAFAKRFRLPGLVRTAPHDPLTLWKLFRLTGRFYRTHHPEEEDDITLVSLHFAEENATGISAP